MSDLTLDDVMARRFALVEQTAIIQGRHKAELDPLNEEIRLCEQFIKSEMLSGNMQQLKTTSGHMTWFTTGDSVTVENWDDALAFIRANGAWHLLNHAINKTAAREHIEVHKAPPPGVKYESHKFLAWKRGKG